jgi:hypothetical protein
MDFDLGDSDFLPPMPGSPMPGLGGSGGGGGGGGGLARNDTMPFSFDPEAGPGVAVLPYSLCSVRGFLLHWFLFHSSAAAAAASPLLPLPPPPRPRLPPPPTSFATTSS